MKTRRALLFSTTLVLVLCAAWGCRSQCSRQPYALNRQLIAALVHDDTKTALALVNAGADPNTRYDPPVPTLKRRPNELLHRKRLPVNDSPTALMLACGIQRKPMQAESGLSPRGTENLPLIEAMLTHHAHINAKAHNGSTALYNAVFDNRLRTVELLLQHGADANAQTNAGTTPLICACSYRQKNQIELVRLLLHFHAEVNYVSPQLGACALDFARVPDYANNPDELVKLLKQAGAKENLPGRYGG